MESIREIFRFGVGPSSSHTMGPRRAAVLFRQKHPEACHFQVTLYGSLAATGKGHLTDIAIQRAMEPIPAEIVWKTEESLPFHPNALEFVAIDAEGKSSVPWRVYSIGGGALLEENSTITAPSIYELHTLGKILIHCEKTGQSYWEYVEEREGQEIWHFLKNVLTTMFAAIQRGLESEGLLPGNLGLQRKAWQFYQKTINGGTHFHQTGLLSAYALAVAEENASGGEIVTAPTCGSCGVLPGVLRYLQETFNCTEPVLLRALATAGLIGNLIKKNASISGAEVGCQGEIGTACAMAAAAAVQVMGGTIRQIEYAAEMGMEHHLGLTCDPVNGLVQIPCIERNAYAATRALTCADYALFSDGSHRISFDDVIQVMKQTGHDLSKKYRETSFGGLAKVYRIHTSLNRNE